MGSSRSGHKVKVPVPPHIRQWGSRPPRRRPSHPLLAVTLLGLLAIAFLLCGVRSTGWFVSGNTEDSGDPRPDEGVEFRFGLEGLEYVQWWPGDGGVETETEHYTFEENYGETDAEFMLVAKHTRRAILAGVMVVAVLSLVALVAASGRLDHARPETRALLAVLATAGLVAVLAGAVYFALGFPGAYHAHWSYDDWYDEERLGPSFYLVATAAFLLVLALAGVLHPRTWREAPAGGDGVRWTGPF